MMRRFLFVVAVTATWFCTTAHAQSLPQIEWELRRPFKLFGAFGQNDNYFTKDVARTGWDYRKDLFVDPGCNQDIYPVTCSEQALGATRLEVMKERLRPEFDSENNSHLRDAWLATATGWNNRVRSHDRTMLDQTERAGIKVRLDGQSVKAMTCQWSTDGIAVDEWKTRCGDWLKNINFRRGPRSSTLKVTVLETGATYELSGSDTRIHERLIVGLGDSFASGEGNPDIPVKLSDELDGDPTYPLRKRRDVDSMIERDAAQWLDRDCHRSLLGAQQRAAIHFSARRPKEETVFLGFACSGAEILEGLIGPYAGTGDTSEYSRAGRRAGNYQQWDGSQIDQVIRALCARPTLEPFRLQRIYNRSELREGKYASKLESRLKRNALEPMILRCPAGFKRPIDAVLLSVGGNDIGFSKIIGGVIVEGWLRPVVSLAGLTQTPEAAKDLIAEELPAKYRELDRILEKHLHISDARKIIVSAYPDPATDRAGKVCGSNPGGLRRGLEAFPERGTATLSAGESASIVKNVVEPLNHAIRKSPYRDGRKWTIADGHVQRVIGHGICAEGLLSKEDTLSTDGYMMEFNPYARTTRWFRTINDSYLIQNQIQVESEMGSTLVDQILASRLEGYLKVYGMIHPNSIGAAANADAYLTRLEELIPSGR